jgi:hypothetical protein
MPGALTSDRKLAGQQTWLEHSRIARPMVSLPAEAVQARGNTKIGIWPGNEKARYKPQHSPILRGGFVRCSRLRGRKRGWMRGNGRDERGR